MFFETTSFDEFSDILQGTSKNYVFGAPAGHFQGKIHPFLTLFQGKGWVSICALY
jgi:hypothetical protein